jgi:hypothetical protein
LKVTWQNLLSTVEHKVGEVVENACGGRILTRQHRGAGGIAQRLLAVGAIKAHAHLREPVEVRRLGDGIAVATDAAVQVIGNEEKHVGFGCWGGVQRDQRNQ